MIAIAIGSFTRPADTTAYAIGDLVANSTTAGSVVAVTLEVSPLRNPGGTIRRVELLKSGAVLTLASFRVHFYRNGVAPAVTSGDNGAWLSTESGYMGSVDITIDKAFSNGAAGFTAQLMDYLPSPGTGSIFALVEARAAYVPASAEVFTIKVEVDRNNNLQ